MQRMICTLTFPSCWVNRRHDRTKHPVQSQNGNVQDLFKKDRKVRNRYGKGAVDEEDSATVFLIINCRGQSTCAKSKWQCPGPVQERQESKK